MTTAATVVGLPLVLATGPGAGARNSIGIVPVARMIIGTVFTPLFIVPSIYISSRARVTVVAPAPCARGGHSRTGGGSMKWFFFSSGLRPAALHRTLADPVALPARTPPAKARRTR